MERLNREQCQRLLFLKPEPFLFVGEFSYSELKGFILAALTNKSVEPHIDDVTKFKKVEIIYSSEDYLTLLLENDEILTIRAVGYEGAYLETTTQVYHLLESPILSKLIDPRVADEYYLLKKELISSQQEAAAEKAKADRLKRYQELKKEFEVLE
ncbi:MAG: hypothetical protein ACRC62_02160 [Microcoleus sp.]